MNKPICPDCGAEGDGIFGKSIDLTLDINDDCRYLYKIWPHIREINAEGRKFVWLDYCSFCLFPVVGTEESTREVLEKWVK